MTFFRCELVTDSGVENCFVGKLASCGGGGHGILARVVREGLEMVSMMY